MPILPYSVAAPHDLYEPTAADWADYCEWLDAAEAGLIDEPPAAREYGPSYADVAWWDAETGHLAVPDGELRVLDAGDWFEIANAAERAYTRALDGGGTPLDAWAARDEAEAEAVRFWLKVAAEEGRL